MQFVQSAKTSDLLKQMLKDALEVVEVVDVVPVAVDEGEMVVSFEGILVEVGVVEVGNENVPVGATLVEVSLELRAVVDDSVDDETLVVV